MKEASSLEFTNLEELEDLAKPPLLPVPVYGYYKSGSDSESTVRDNRRSFSGFKLLPRILVDVSRLDASTTLLGRKLAFPVLIAPMAMMRMAHTEGESAVARAAGSVGLPMVQSTMGTVALEDVRAAGKETPFMMFQLYVIKDRAFTKRLVQRAEACGYNGLVVTVDAPFLGNREADVRSRFKLPEGLELANLRDLGRGFGEHEWSRERPASGFEASFSSQVDASLDWGIIPWLRGFTTLPIFVKGVLTPEDARLAMQAGVDGIIVSNHGGRQLDSAPSAIDVLPGIASAVNRRVPLLVDGGFRRGTDVIKALALGADAVLLGRPILYGLALGGQQGVHRVLEILRKEFCLSLALMGCPSIRHLSRSQVVAPWEHPARL